jgi:hypothetical protein
MRVPAFGVDLALYLTQKRLETGALEGEEPVADRARELDGCGMPLPFRRPTVIAAAARFARLEAADDGDGIASPPFVEAAMVPFLRQGCLCPRSQQMVDRPAILSRPHVTRARRQA